MEDWAEIRRLHRAEGLSIKKISRRFGVSRKPVCSALRADRRAMSGRGRRPRVDLFEPAIRDLLASSRG